MSSNPLSLGIPALAARREQEHRRRRQRSAPASTPVSAPASAPAPAPRHRHLSLVRAALSMGPGVARKVIAVTRSIRMSRAH